MTFASLVLHGLSAISLFGDFDSLDNSFAYDLRGGWINTQSPQSS